MHAFDEDIAAAVGLDEIGPEEIASAEKTLGHRHAALAQIVQKIAAGLDLGRSSSRPLLVPGPPILLRGCAVEGALAGHGDVLLLEGINEGGVVEALRALPAGVDRRQILGGIGDELQGGTSGDVEVDIALQMDGARQEDACGGYGHVPPTRFVTGFDGLPDGLGAIRFPICHRPVVRDRKFAGGKHGGFDAGENLGDSGPFRGSGAFRRRGNVRGLRSRLDGRCEAEQFLQFDAGKDEGPHPLEVVINDGLAEVVLVGAVAAIAESGPGTALGQGDLARFVDLDEFLDEPRVAFQE